MSNINIPVENVEAFAKLNFLRDVAVTGEKMTWTDDKEIYMEEANHYVSGGDSDGFPVLSLEELNAMLAYFKLV